MLQYATNQAKQPNLLFPLDQLRMIQSVNTPNFPILVFVSGSIWYFGKRTQNAQLVGKADLPNSCFIELNDNEKPQAGGAIQLVVDRFANFLKHQVLSLDVQVVAVATFISPLLVCQLCPFLKKRPDFDKSCFFISHLDYSNRLLEYIFYGTFQKFQLVWYAVNSVLTVDISVDREQTTLNTCVSIFLGSQFA